MGMYDDMLDLVHPMSARHPRMSELDRAAQFAPFAALTGYDRIIVETGRITGSRLDMDETKIGSLNDTLNELIGLLRGKPEVEIVRFIPDKYKDGGEYVELKATVRDVDTVNRFIILTDRRKIDFDDIFDLRIVR